MTNEQVRDEVIETVRRINAAWLEGAPEDVEPFLHPDAVVVQPGFTVRSVGVHAAIDRYSEFRENATIRDFRESDHVVDTWEDATAVVTYRLELDYERDGETHHDVRTEIVVLMRAGDGWRATWRTTVLDA